MLCNSAGYAARNNFVDRPPGQGGPRPPTGGLALRRKTEKRPLGESLLSPDGLFLPFVLPRRLIATPKSSSGTLFELYADSVRQMRGPGGSSPWRVGPGGTEPPGGALAWSGAKSQETLSKPVTLPDKKMVLPSARETRPAHRQQAWVQGLRSAPPWWFPDKAGSGSAGPRCRRR